MKQDTQNGIKCVNANVGKMKMFVLTNKGVIKINADLNAKN